MGTDGFDDAGAGGVTVSPELTAWREFCRLLGDTGERVLEPGANVSNPDPAEALRHLATQLVCWLGDSLAAERDLGIHRLNDLLTPWGGPNADNVYRYARIDDAGTYRLHGRMHGCEQFLMALRVGNLHQKANGTLAEASAADLGIGPGDEVDILLRPAASGGAGVTAGAGSHTVEIPAGTRMLSVREYYYDWRPLEPANLMLERIDGNPSPLDVTGALAEAGEQLTESLTHWSDYMDDARERGTDNTFIPPRREPRGLATMNYSFCFWALAPDEALVVRLTEPVARYWSLQLYQLRWFEGLDFARPTSLNQVQLTPDRSGTYTCVVSASDPGIANWLDTCGRRDGLLTFRCAWLSAAAPHPETEVVKLEELDRLLGPDVTRREAPARAAQLAARKDHLRWRFRT